MKQLIIAVDFDGTIIEHNFPNIGKPIPYAIEALKILKAAGHKTILWTCREDSPQGNYLTDAIEYCRNNGVEFDAVNDNIKPYEDHLYTNSRKVYANLYIDDKNRIDRYVDWIDILRDIFKDLNKSEIIKLFSIQQKTSIIDNYDNIPYPNA